VNHLLVFQLNGINQYKLFMKTFFVVSWKKVLEKNSFIVFLKDGLCFKLIIEICCHEILIPWFFIFKNILLKHVLYITHKCVENYYDCTSCERHMWCFIGNLAGVGSHIPWKFLW